MAPLQLADRRQQILSIGLPHVFRNSVEQRNDIFVADNRLRPPPLDFLVDQIFSSLKFFNPFRFLDLTEIRPNLRTRFPAARDLEPVTRRNALRRGNDFDDLAVLQIVAHRNYPVVDHRSDASRADLRVYRKGEVNRRRSLGKRDNHSLWREDQNYGRQDVILETFHEFGGVSALVVSFNRLTYPCELCIEVVPSGTAFLVSPVGRDSVLRKTVHFPGPYLHFERFSGRSDYGRMKRLIHIVLGIRNVIVKLARYGFPDGVNDSEDGITIRQRLDNDSKRQQIVELLDRESLAVHLFEDAVKMLCAPLDLACDPVFLQTRLQDLHRLVDRRLAFRKFFSHSSPDLVVHFGIGILERKILETALDLIDSEPMRKGRVYFERLLGDSHLLVPSEGAERPHVVETVRKLD